MKSTWKFIKQAYAFALYRPGARVLVEAACAGEGHEADLGIAEDGELLGFLEDPVPPLGEGHLPARGVINPADHNLPPPHLSQIRLASLTTNEKWSTEGGDRS